MWNPVRLYSDLKEDYFEFYMIFFVFTFVCTNYKSITIHIKYTTYMIIRIKEVSLGTFIDLKTKMNSNLKKVKRPFHFIRNIPNIIYWENVEQVRFLINVLNTCVNNMYSHYIVH